MKMLQAVKVASRSQPNPFPLSSFGKKTTAVRFPQAKFVSTQAESQKQEGGKMSSNTQSQEGQKNMNNTQNPSQEEKNVDGMTRAFGEGYSTRSEEEGFGGVYGGKQRLRRSDDDDDEKVFPKVQSDHDATQGHPVKEKEKSRHQSDVPNPS